MNKKIDRRGFLKTAAISALGLGAAGALSACDAASSSTAASSGAASSGASALSYTPGTYTATAAGISSDVTVTATFDASTITELTIDVSGETKGIGADIAETMVERILDAQTCNVDGVSGATVTSNAVKTALADCMSQASGTKVTVNVDVDAAEEVDLNTVVPTKTIETDAVVLGCGAAGIQAALTLQAMGPDVIVIRHPSSGAAQFLAERVSCGIVNGGDGWHAHPTQALLDSFALRQVWGDAFAGKQVLILGDIAHSRVARSNVHLLTMLGAKVRLNISSDNIMLFDRQSGRCITQGSLEFLQV